MFGRADNIVNAVWKLLLRITLVAVVIFCCYRLRGLIITLFLAAIVAYVLDPAVEWLSRNPTFIRIHDGLAGFGNLLTSPFRLLKKRTASDYDEELVEGGGPHIKSSSGRKARMGHHGIRTCATIYVFVVSIVILWQGVIVLSKPFTEEIKMAMTQENREKMAVNAKAWMERYDNIAPDWAQSDVLKDKVIHSDLPKMIQQYTLNFGKSLVENSKYVVEAVLLPVLAFYFLIDGRSLKHEFAGLMKGGRRKETLRISREFNHIMRAFISGQVIVCLLAGVVVWVGLGLLHINYSLLLGVLAGLSRAIPVIGSVIGGIPIILLTLAQTKSIPTTLTVLGFFTLLHFTESKFILPLLLGERMELHPVLIIVVLIIGGEIGSVLMGGLFGSLLGMFFAAPLASIIRVLIRRYWLRVRVRPFSSV